MNKIIVKCHLFEGLSEEKISNILSCINNTIEEFKKGLYLYNYSKDFKAGICLEGRLDLSYIDDDGNEIIDRIYNKGDCFVINFSSLKDRIMIAKEDCKILSLNVFEIYDNGNKKCPVRAAFMENIINLQNENIAYFSYKLGIYSKSKLREKIISSMENNMSEDFLNGKYTREDFAKFLSCNRSALSRELSNMKEEGML